MKNKINNITLGSDPEVFLWNVINEEFHSAVGFNKGTKRKPLQMEGLDKGFMWQVDCVALEYNIPPATYLKDWILNHRTALDYMKSKLPDELILSIKASARFNDNHLKTKQANTFGCDPDFNVWKGEYNVSPDPLVFGNLRSCGGHISIGYDNPKEEISKEIVKAFDLFCTLPSLLLDPDTERRQLYGKAGSFRFKNFGVECRSLSNFWLVSEGYMAWVFEQTHKAIEYINSGKGVKGDLAEMLPAVIDENNKDLAYIICREHKIEFPEVLETFPA